MQRVSIKIERLQMLKSKQGGSLPNVPRGHATSLANSSVFLSSAAAVVLPPDHPPPDRRLCCPLRCSRCAHPRYLCRQEIALMSPRCRLTRSSTHRLAIPVRRRLCTRFRSTTTTLSRVKRKE
ncbi:hypothetical protein DAI22_11g168800 [Oryza sativa Japonica Group]|nr:hypothetical protein DAI22_11g168800 [Oryza sativa Japonica Group]